MSFIPIILSQIKNLFLLGNILRGYNTVRKQICPNWVIMTITGQY